MHDHEKHVGGAQEAYSEYNTPRMSYESYGAEQPILSPVAHGNSAAGNLSDGRSNTGDVPNNAPASSPGDDDEAQANSDLLAAWMQRLQILTIVTTFLTSMDGQLFSLSALNTQIGLTTSTARRELVYSCLSGALVFHICACILGYIASFALIQYKIVDAAHEDDPKAEGVQSLGVGLIQPARRLPRRIILETVHPRHRLAAFLQHPVISRFIPVSQESHSSPPPPLSLLTHCYFTTLCLSTVGFLLALTGILAYIWAGLPVPVGIFSTICLGIAISATVWALAI